MNTKFVSAIRFLVIFPVAALAGCAYGAEGAANEDASSGAAAVQVDDLVKAPGLDTRLDAITKREASAFEGMKKVDGLDQRIESAAPARRARNYDGMEKAPSHTDLASDVAVMRDPPAGGARSDGNVERVKRSPCELVDCAIKAATASDEAEVGELDPGVDISAR